MKRTMRTMEEYQTVMAMNADGMSRADIVHITGISQSTVRAWILGIARSNGYHNGRMRTRERGSNWKGDAAKPRTIKDRGRVIARRLYPFDGEECAEPTCMALATDRHHEDGDTTNNDPRNIMNLCRSCHMKIDTARLHHKEGSIVGRSVVRSMAERREVITMFESGASKAKISRVTGIPRTTIRAFINQGATTAHNKEGLVNG